MYCKGDGMMTKEELIKRLNKMLLHVDMQYAYEECAENIVYGFPNASETHLSDWEYGATKLVLFFNDLPDYVVKLPFHSSGESDDEYNEDDDEYDYYWFEGADNSVDRSDYCQTEVEVYHAAQERGVEKFFAKTEYLYTHLSGERVYLQERCSIEDLEEIEALHPVESSKAITDKCGNRTKNINGRWLILAYEYYGEEKFVEFMKFLYDQNINDLHDGNLGMINGRPVILDYSGFND